MFEYQTYCSDVLDKPKSHIFDRCYEIDAIVNIYEIMVKKVEQLPEHIIGELLKVKGILHLIYSEWLKKDDGCWLELEGHVADELKILERSDKKGDFDI